MKKESKFFINRQRLKAFLMLLLISFSFIAITPKPAQAQLDVNQAVNNILTPIWDFLKKAYEKGGAAAFQTVVRTALNKIAYDTANWIGSGGKGQKPTFITQDWGDYLLQIGDEAAGQFIEQAVTNWQSANWKSDEKGSKLNEQCSKSLNQCLEEYAGKASACISNCAPGNNYNSCVDDCNKKYSAEACEDASIQCAGVTTASDGTTAARSSASAVSVCRPSSIEARLQIAMGLVDNNRPQAPNCSASELVENWDNYYQKLTAFKDPNFLNQFSNIFNPVSNDLGIYMTLKANQRDIINEDVEDSKTKLIADGGWLDLRDIAGNLTGTPGDSARKAELAEQGYINNMAEFSGDALIDAANVFLNQLALSSYNRLMSGLGKKATENNNSGGTNNFSNPGNDPNLRYGEGSVKESAASIIAPTFTTRGDYSILVALSTCMDRNNPGPTDCVLNDRLVQGITEKATVAEAIKANYLSRDWQFTTEYRESTYNLRNIQIMRKYRIVPLAWEEAAKASKQSTLGDLVSCFSATDEHDDYSLGFDVKNQAWCRGLIDPNWVLKAPLNYCAKQGYGNQILNIDVIPIVDANGETINTIQMTRADNYCADEQTCINENEDGSCENYGYCASERLTWNFDSQSCQAIDNTCSSFTNSISGQQVTYLENTLDYGNCNADSAGCKRYSLAGSYDISNGQVVWSANPFANAYFNKQLSACSSSDEGCHEMMRVKPSWGFNLVMGANFANDNVGDSLVNNKINNYWGVWTASGTREAEIIDTSSLDGTSLGKAIKLDSTGDTIGVYSNNAGPLIPANFNVLAGETYTLSADVYLISGDKVQAVLGADYTSFTETQDKEVWRRLSVTRSLKDQPLSEMFFQIVAYSTSPEPVSFAVRNIKLEMSSFDSGFSDYGAYKVYQKLLPDYLKEACYINSDPSNPDYRLRVDAPAACSSFVRQCNRDEAGCESYKEASTGFSVAAQAITTDYCDASCNGYDIYISRANYFYSPQAENIIPQNSQFCTAQAVGCSQFTNLDEVAAGGEGREYYTQLKQCIKPGAACDDFYTWVGTEESGYQLRSFILKKDIQGNPAVTSNNAQTCNEDTFNLPPNDPSFNSDCRQYYNKSGQISYRLESSTITCSENCNTYRLSENNIDSTVNQAQCVGNDRFWNNTSSACYVCKNGGVWNESQQACLYQAIPDEGQTCNAAQNGCREYNGDLGNNTRLAASNSFADGTEAWTGQCGDAAIHSQVSNYNNGQSLLYDKGANSGGINHQTMCDQVGGVVTWLDRFIGSAQAAPESFIRRILGRTVTQDKSYSLKFTASAALDANVYFAFLNSNDEMSYFNATEANPTGSFIISGNNEWRSYELNLPALDHVVDNKEALIIVSDGDFYLDNIVLTEISDRYYLIKNSSQIPDVCYYDILDNYQGPDYNLGCSLYNDRSNNSHYLRQFNKLCQDSAVGCELMIDTSNYTNFKSGLWKDLDGNGTCDSEEPECLGVGGDRFFYAIYDESKRCNSADLGCSRMGQAVSSGNNLNWSDVFKRNNPNNYDRILCNAEDADCEAWQYKDDRGVTYFKNPGNNVCVYRNSADPEDAIKTWYKTPVTRCDLDNSGTIDANELGTKICSSASDCPANRPCILDNNDYECPVSYFKTFGHGGSGSQIPVPSESVGVCEPAASGCTEYIDPVSSFSTNLVRNLGLDEVSIWEGSGAESHQDVTIEPNSLYVFSVFKENGNLDYNVRLESDLGVFLLEENNNLSSTSSPVLTIPANNKAKRFIFHSRNNSQATVFGGSENHIISLKKVIINYQLQQNIDKTSCNGLVDADNGCILFNERSTNGASGLLSLSGAYNAAISQNNKIPQTCLPGYCDANTLIKVKPDRVCASWLDCITYTLDLETNEKICYALGECNALNDQGECMNFTTPDDTVVSSNTSDISRLTGYSVLDQYALAGMKEVGINTDAHYDFEGSSTCQQGSPFTDCDIIDSPDNTLTDYPAESKAYLVVSSNDLVFPNGSGEITIQPDQDYYIHFLLNTKGSGSEAKILVYLDDTTQLLWSETVSSPNGWERKVLKIPASDLDGADSISLALDVEVPPSITQSRKIFFDDINIEPVLEVGPDQYVAKECRLFPSQDSISCSSKNNQVIKDGLIGYCLQRDPANKNVCLLWHPVDEVSAAAKSARSQLGYQGAFPLRYCTEANGNFDLVKKKEAYFYQQNVFGDWCENVSYPPGFYAESSYCELGYMLYRSNQDGKDNDDDAFCLVNDWCVPKTSQAQVVIYTKSSLDWFKNCGGDPHTYVSPFKVTYTYSGYFNTDNLLVYTSPSTLIQAPSHDGGECGYIQWLGSLSEGWYPYNNLYGDEGTNADPPIRIYDYNNPPISENGLKRIESTNPDEVYYPTCNQFTTVVDNAGNNIAWSKRTSVDSVYPTITPSFFRDLNRVYTSSPANNFLYFNKYGRNRELVPFGAATFPEGFDITNQTSLIKLKNRYSSVNPTILAGRPYGCSGPGCGNIGYCSVDPNVYCILDTTGSSVSGTNNSDACGSAYGTCLSLWDGDNLNIETNNDSFRAENILKNLFLRSFGGYVYNNSLSHYEVNTIEANYEPDGASYVPFLGNNFNAGAHDTSNDNNFSAYWGAIYPKITNVQLFLNGTPVSSSPNGTFYLDNPGIYELRFNTIVDAEQQPLKNIQIKWDAENSGDFQNISNLDAMPNPAQPHQIFHYYKDITSKRISIRVFDNWGFHGDFGIFSN